MKIAIVGSRDVTVTNLEEYVSEGDVIVSGGAKGVDTCAAQYARAQGLELVEFLPKYQLYGRAAPIKRNYEIVDYADKVIVFWNGTSKGSESVIKYANKIGKPCEVVICK